MSVVKMAPGFDDWLPVITSPRPTSSPSFSGSSPDDLSIQEKGALIPVLVGFIGIAGLCISEVEKNRRLLNSEPDLASSSAGWEMRKWFHALLGVANILRAISIVVELVVPSDGDCTEFTCLILGVSQSVPDLAFLTTYSLLILFWAQLYYATWGVSYASLRPGFLLANNLVIVVFVIIAVVGAVNRTFDVARTDVFYLFAVTYVACALLMLFYGLKVISQLRLKTTVSQAFPARDMIIRRVSILCAMCSTVLTIRAAYCVCAVTLFKDNLGYPDLPSRHAFDAALYTTLDFLPSIVLLIMTVKKQASQEDADGTLGGDMSSQGAGHTLFSDGNSELYAPLQMTPPTLVDESLTARLFRSDAELEQQSRQI